MRNLIIISIVLLSISINAQSLNKDADLLLGQKYDEVVDKDGRIIKTHFGTLPVFFKGKKGMIMAVKFKITNDHHLYDSVMSSLPKCAQIKIGKMWSDISFEYELVKTLKTKSEKEAIEYYYSFSESKVKSYKDIRIYKHKNKNKFIVARYMFRHDAVLTDDGKARNTAYRVYKEFE